MRKELFEAIQRIGEGDTIKGYKTDRELETTSSPIIESIDYVSADFGYKGRATEIARDIFNADANLERLDSSRNR